jgi:hypothetical protein
LAAFSTQASISRPSSGVMARDAMMRSQPMSSPVSSKMHLASFSMSQSKHRPTAGFAVMPLVPSEPPHTVPITSSSSAIGTVVWPTICARIFFTDSMPAFNVRVVPPACWITSRSTGRPLAWMCRRSSSRLKLSQPSETSNTAPTFGCVHRRFIISSAYLLG